MKYFVFLSLLLFSSSFFGQEFFEIQFEVSNYETKEKLDSNKVILKDPTGKIIWDTLVNSTFRYKFKVIKKGFYTVELTNNINYLKYDASLVTHGKYRYASHNIRLNYSDNYYLTKLSEYKALNIQEDSIYGDRSSVAKDDIEGFIESEYLGGLPELTKFITKNLIYPYQSIEEGEQGKVYVKFIVEKDGNISHVNIIKGVSPRIDCEAIRVIRSLPNFRPAMDKNGPIRCFSLLPLNFSLQ